jgi:hypothetical protein
LSRFCAFRVFAGRRQRALARGAHLAFDLLPARRVHGLRLHRSVPHHEEHRDEADRCYERSNEEDGSTHRRRLSVIGR